MTGKRIQITSTAEHLHVIRRKVSGQKWCDQCGAYVDLINGETIHGLTEADAEALRQLHYMPRSDGSRRICVNLLSQWLEKEIQKTRKRIEEVTR